MGKPTAKSCAFEASIEIGRPVLHFRCLLDFLEVGLSRLVGLGELIARSVSLLRLQINDRLPEGELRSLPFFDFHRRHFNLFCSFAGHKVEKL